MELTNKQKAIKERREYAYTAYTNKPFDLAVSSLVKAIAKKFNVTEVQIYNDIKAERELLSKSHNP
jgi:hypothetical protein